jgi:peptide/nickel transport system substrate-binding protein
MTVLTQLMPPGAPGYDPEATGQRYDYAAALEHMRLAGYPYDPVTGKGGWPDPIVYPLYEGGTNVYTAQLLQQDLARIGLRIVLKLMSWPAFLAAHQRPDGAAISQMAWEMDYPDPSSYFEPLFATSSIGAEAGNNSSRYSNPRYDQLVARAHHELDPGKRAALYREASRILCDDAPWAFTYAYHGFDLRQPYVHRYAPHPVWPLDVTRTWIDRATTALQRVIGQEAAR